MTAIEKQCTKCKETKPAAKFQKRGNVASGLASWCRQCTQDYINREQGPRRRNEGKRRIVALKGGKCMRCEGVFPHYVYDLHHRDPSKKEMYLSDLSNKSFPRAVAEAEKCDLLCANCHRITHYEIYHAYAEAAE